MALTTTIKLDLSAFSASLQEVGKKAVATAADIQQAFAKNAKIDVDTNPIINEMKKVEAQASKTGSMISKIKEGFSASSIGNMAAGFTAAGAITKGAEMAVNAVKSVIDVGQKYETAMADFSAITGVQGDALSGFGDKAKDLAKQFGGSAIEQINSFKGVLSRLGPDIAKSPEALQSMTESINTLAKAGGLSAAESMDALTTGMLQYGISLEDPKQAAGEMARMMNVMAAGAKEGAAEIPQVKDAIVVAGVAAKGANVSFEETNAAIQTLATGGKYGAEAGTALRNVLGKMAGSDVIPKEAVEKLTALGVNMDVVSNKSLPLSQRLQELSKANADATAMAQIFGTENAAAATILTQGADKVADFTTKLTGTNVASEQAAINMNTMAERISRLKAWVESFAIDTYNAVMSIVTPIVNFVGDIFENVIKPFYEGIIGGIIEGFKPLYDAIVGLWNEISNLFKSTGEGIDLWKILKDVASTLGQVIGGVLKVSIQLVLTPLKLMYEGFTFLVHSIGQGIDALKNFVNSGNPVAVFIRSLWQGFKDLLGTIGGTIEKVLQFLGILKNDGNKAPLKKQIVVDTKHTTSGTPDTAAGLGAPISTKIGGGGAKSAKPKEDPNIKYQQEMNAEIAKGKQDISKKELEENLQLLQQKKDNILNDTKITEQERLKAVLAAEQDIELQKLDIALLGLEQRYKAELAQEEKKFQDLKKAGKVNEESERLHRERIKQIDAEYEADFMKEVAKNDTAINKAKVENAKKTQDAIRKGEEESKKLREQEAKDEDEFIQQGIKRKFKGEEQKYQLALYALQKEYRAGTISEEEYLTRKLEMYKEYLYQTNTLYRMSQDFKDSVRDAFSQKEDKKATSALKDEIKGYDDQEKALKESLNKRQITKKEYAEKFKEIEKQRQEKEEQLEEKSFSFKKNLLKSFQLLFEKTLKDRAVAENVAEKKHAAMMADQTATDEQRFKASADLLKEYASTAAVQLGEVLASGKATLGDVLVVVIDAAAKMLTAMIPVWIAGIMGTTTSQMGIWGLVVAGGLIALVTGLAAAAKSSLSSAKGGASKGYLPGVQGYTEPADIDTELVRKSPREAILDEQMTAENRDVLDFMFKTKKTAREYFGMSIKPADIDTELARKSPNEAIPDEQKTAREYFGMSIKPQDVAAAPQINNGGGESVGAETAREYFGMSIKPQYIVAAPKVNAGRGESVGAEIARALAGMNGERNSRIGVELDINGRLTNTGDIMVFAERQRAKNLKTF